MPQVIIHTSLAMIFLWLAGVVHNQKNRFGHGAGGALTRVCQGMWLFTVASLSQVAAAYMNHREVIEATLGVVTFLCVTAGLIFVLRGMSHWKSRYDAAGNKPADMNIDSRYLAGSAGSVTSKPSSALLVERTNVAVERLTDLSFRLSCEPVDSNAAPELVFEGIRSAMYHAFDASFVMLAQRLPELNLTVIFSASGERGNISRAFYPASRFIEAPIRINRDDCIHEMPETPRFDSRIGWEYLSRSSAKRALVIRTFASRGEAEQCLVAGWSSRAVNLREMRNAFELVLHDLRLVLDGQVNHQSGLSDSGVSPSQLSMDWSTDRRTTQNSNYVAGTDRGVSAIVEETAGQV